MTPLSVAALAGYNGVLMSYQTNETNQAALNTAMLADGRSLFTSLHGLNTLRENQRHDKILCDYKVKMCPSQLINGGSGVWFCGYSAPV